MTGQQKNNRTLYITKKYPGGSEGKKPAMRENQVRSLGREDSLEKEMATHCIILV